MGRKKQTPAPKAGEPTTSAAPAAQATGADPPAPKAGAAAPTSPPTVPDEPNSAGLHQAEDRGRRAADPAGRGGAAPTPSRGASRNTRHGTDAPRAPDTLLHQVAPPIGGPTGVVEERRASRDSTTPTDGPAQPQASQAHPTRDNSRLAATTPGNTSNQRVSDGQGENNRGLGMDTREEELTPAGKGASGGRLGKEGRGERTPTTGTEEEASPDQSVQQGNGNEEQGDAVGEEAGQEEQGEAPREEEAVQPEEGAPLSPQAPTRSSVWEEEGGAELTAVAGPGVEEAAATRHVESAQEVAAAQPEQGETGTASAATADGEDGEAGGTAAREVAERDRHDLAEGETQAQGNQADHAARAPNRRSLQLQPGRRWLGAGLTPGRPGPLWGWDRQFGQEQPRGEGPSGTCPSSSREARTAATAGDRAAGPRGTATHGEGEDRELPGAEEQPQEPIATDREQGPPNAAGRARGQGRGRGRGGRRGRGRRGGAAINARERVRSGPWRERHGRPERVSEETNADRPEGADSEEDDEAYMASEEGESEEVSLDDEPEVGNHHAPTRSGRPQQGENGRAEGEQNNVGPAPEERVGQQAGEDMGEMRTPEIIAGDEATWRKVEEWDVDCLRGSDQSLLAQRLPPKMADSFAACLVIPVQRLKKNPTCQDTSLPATFDPPRQCGPQHGKSLAGD
ncbi:unnamed protein product [Closterium sp. Naga37s-1]|nr:unnamed protein product [Closterium sp. Naga37s-1]